MDNLKARKLSLLIKSLIFIALASVSFSAFANFGYGWGWGGGCCRHHYVRCCKPVKCVRCVYHAPRCCKVHRSCCGGFGSFFGNFGGCCRTSYSPCHWGPYGNYVEGYWLSYRR